MSDPRALVIGHCYICHTPIGYPAYSDKLIHFVTDGDGHLPSLAADPETAAKNIAEARERLKRHPV